MAYLLITANRNYSIWSLRPWLLMKTLGIAFDEWLEPFAAATNYAAFRKFSPTGQVPVLQYCNRTIHDSIGITLYLASRHAGVWPDEPVARSYAQCAVAEMHSEFAALRSECAIIIAQPAMQQWETQALAETWREIGHEAELAASGKLLADYRAIPDAQ